MSLFSIVMPIYNAERWLEDAFYSLVNQKNIDFENEVEVILVNDCSVDNSKEICLNICRKFKNVKYIENIKNSGSSVSRNAGLRRAEGLYVNFFDSDDLLSQNVLYELKKFILTNKEKIAHISIPLIYFEAAKGLHPKYTLLGKKNRIIDLRNEPSNFILSAASSFYKRSDLVDLNLQFDESLFCEEDTRLNFALYSKVTPKFAYICENEVSYQYRKRKEANSQVDQGKNKKEAYSVLLSIINSIKKDEKIPNECFYELCIYELRSRLKNIKESIFEDRKEFLQILNEYRKIIKEIPLNFIINKTKFLSFDEKLLFVTNIFSKRLKLENDGQIISKEDGQPFIRINEIPIEIKSIHIEKNELKVEGILNLYGLTNIGIVLINEKTKERLCCQREYDTESIYIRSVDFIKSSNSIKYFEFCIPLYSEGVYSLYFLNKNTGYIHRANRIKTYSENPFLPVSVFNCKSFKKFTEYGTSIVLYNKQFIVQKTKIIDKILDRIKTVAVIYKKHNKFKWLRFLKIGKPKYWLFNDRPINANDNSEALFHYVNEFYPDISRYCYFVLSKNSPEIERLKKIGNVVIQNSLKHKILFLNAKYIITSHLALSFFKPFSIKFLKYYNDLLDSKIIWLQHGITMNDIEIAANKFNKQIDKISVSAKFEKEIFSQKKYFFDAKDIIESGFARYDLLHNRSSKRILIMPTWRSYLSGKILSNGLHAPIPGFQDSDYYIQYSKLLTNRKLLDFIKYRGYKITFVLHPGLRQYARFFKKFESSNVEIIDSPSVSYRDLFSTSSLMVTDYSSVFFDFVYMKKPCIYFQFDSEDFFAKHYKEGLFKFKTMAPGPICTKVEDVVNEILLHDKNDMKIFPIYFDRLKKIFLFTDRLNCHRIIKELL